MKRTGVRGELYPGFGDMNARRSNQLYFFVCIIPVSVDFRNEPEKFLKRIPTINGFFAIAFNVHGRGENVCTGGEIVSFFSALSALDGDRFDHDSLLFINHFIIIYGFSVSALPDNFKVLLKVFSDNNHTKSLSELTVEN